MLVAPLHRMGSDGNEVLERVRDTGSHSAPDEVERNFARSTSKSVTTDVNKD